MNTPSLFLRASSAVAAFAFVFATDSSRGEVPQGMRKDFVTARNHVAMKWNPQGYWISPPGAFLGRGSIKEVCAVFTSTEQARGRIPAGYSFYVSETGQFVASNGPLGKSGAARPVAAAAPAPPPVAASPVPAPFAAEQVPAPDIPSTPVMRAAPVIDAAAPLPRTLTPTPAMRSAILDPVHATPAAAPRPSSPTVSASPPSSLPIPPPPPVNGIPGELQKSFLSRHKSVFMVFDESAGKWKSSEGALKDASTAEEWCKQATEIDRRAKRIPETFSYKHVSGGQVEATRD